MQPLSKRCHKQNVGGDFASSLSNKHLPGEVSKGICPNAGDLETIVKSNTDHSYVMSHRFRLFVQVHRMNDRPAYLVDYELAWHRLIRCTTSSMHHQERCLLAKATCRSRYSLLLLPQAASSCHLALARLLRATGRVQ